MKNGSKKTLIPFFISGVLFSITNVTLAQPKLSGIETKNLEYTAGDGQVAVTSSIQVDARFYIYSATIRITEGYNSSEDLLVYKGSYLNIASSWDNSTGTMTLTGFASESRYRTALRSIFYENINEEDPSNETRTVSFMVNDGNNSNTVSRKITILQNDLAPVIGNLESDPQVFCMNSGSVLITESLTITDEDDTNLQSANISITTGYTATEDRLLFTNQNGISGSWNSNSGQLILTGQSSVLNYQQALRSIRYENTNPENPHAGHHDITFSVSDGILPSNSMSRSIIHTVPSAVISGSYSVCRDEEAAIQVSFTGTAPWSIKYSINSGLPVTLQNIPSNPFILPAGTEGTYTLTEVNDKYCPGNVSGSAVVDILPEPEVTIVGLASVYTKESTDMISLTGIPDGGTFTGPGVIHYDNGWFFFPALPPVGVHQIIYQYRPDAASCYGYDTATVRILEKSAAIEMENDRTHFCINDQPFLVTGINLLNTNPGSFTITGEKGIIDHGNNTATIFPDALEINQYTLTYTASGGIQAEQTFEIGGPLTASFNWNAECFNQNTPIIFTNTSTSPFGFLNSDSYHWTVYTEPDSITYSSKDITYSFPEPGNYTLKLTIRNSYGCVNELSRVFPLRPIYALAGHNYTEDFEGERLWESGYNPDAGTNSWELGKPDLVMNGFSNPYSGENCWFTTATMNPIPREESWITSPCFDFTGTEKPTLVARIRRSFTDTRDGANVSYTTDNGIHWNPVGVLNDGINWFNGYFGNPGSQSQGWTAIIDNNWVEARHILDFLKNEPVVQFRFSFIASGSALGNKGIAVDDIKIVERNRTILIEHFTNTTQAASDADEMLDEIAQLTGPNVIDLQYHTSDPRDPFYSQNPVIPNTRQFYYGLNNVPYSVINGGSLNTQLIDYKDRYLSPGQIGIESLFDSDFDLKVTTMLEGNRLYAEAIITSLRDVPLSELSVRMVVIEPLIIDSTITDEDSVFRNVVRAMLPDAAGNSIYRTWQQDDHYRIVEWLEIDPDLNPEVLRVVAFIQDEQTRVVHQAALDEAGLINNTADPSGDEAQIFSVFPNPARDHLNIEFRKETVDSYDIELLNNLGESVYRQSVRAISGVHSVPVGHLPEGMYILRVAAANSKPQTGKIIITH